MGIIYAPLVADLFLFCYERDCMLSFFYQVDFVEAFKVKRKTNIRNQYNQVLHLTYLFVVDLSNRCTSFAILCIDGVNQRYISQGRYKATMT